MDDPLQPLASASVQGWFDDQLDLSAAYGELARTKLTVRKRDGRSEEFHLAKIAAAITRAARAVALEDTDLARGLALGVALYLNRLDTGESFGAAEVHAAVERVLIEMGYGHVAAAFSRERERKDRLAALSSGADRADAGALPEEIATEGGIPVTVIDSDDTISHWDRGRIVKALLRETPVDETEAGHVAAEVEERVVKLGLSTVTAGLVRELAGAILVSRGNVSGRSRHLRLGIPLFDAERTIRGQAALRPDPEQTNEALAGRLKKEFALARVFSRDVTEAHRWGDLYIDGLESIDRLASLVAMPDWIKSHGLPGGAALRARRADTLVAQMAGASVALQRYFTQGVEWDALNWFIAPFLDGFGAEALSDLARVVVYEFAYRAMVRPGGAPVTLGLSWSMPQRLRNASPVGPRDEEVQSDYEAYTEPAQRFALAILDVYQAATDRNPQLKLPGLRTPITPDCFLEDGFSEFLTSVAGAARHGRVQVDFERDTQLFAFDEDLVSPREVVAQELTLNLARAAYRSRGESDLLAECERLLELAVAAHTQKREFIRSLLDSGEAGPLGLLARRYDGQPWVSAERTVYRVSIAGLAEAIDTTFGTNDSREQHEGQARIVSALAASCENWSRERAIEIQLAPAISDRARRNLAERDLRYYHAAASKVLKLEDKGARLSYSSPNDFTQSTQSFRGLLDGPASLLDRFSAKAGLRVPQSLHRADTEDIALAIQEAFQKGLPGLVF